MAIGHLHQGDSEAVFIDMGHTFDAAYASACGADLSRLLVVHPPDMIDALSLIRDMAASSVVALIVLDAAFMPLLESLRRLHKSLAASQTALLILSRVAPVDTHLRLHIACTGWIHDEADVIGCRVRANLQQHPTLPTGTSAEFDLRFGKGVPDA